MTAEHGVQGEQAEVVHAEDCQFVFSPSRTVHERDRDGEGGFEFHPQCGTRLPAGSKWGRVQAESVEQIAREHPELTYCSRCINTGTWWRGLEESGER